MLGNNARNKIIVPIKGSVQFNISRQNLDKTERNDYDGDKSFRDKTLMSHSIYDKDNSTKPQTIVGGPVQ